jgi:hypothetical protein
MNETTVIALLIGTQLLMLGVGYMLGRFDSEG